ncbi:MAG: hypothetical protein AAF492_16665, partial [Verrucomicrobiota bacterium]
MTASNLPPGSVFVPQVAGGSVTGQFTWVTAGPPGVYTSMVYAASPDGVDTQPVTIVVKTKVPIWINEVDYDQVGVDSNEWIELVGASGFNLDAYELVFINGADGQTYATHNLPNYTFPDEVNGFGFFVIGRLSITNVFPDFTPATWNTVNEIQNNGAAPDTIVLRHAGTLEELHRIDYGEENRNDDGIADQVSGVIDPSAVPLTPMYLTGGPGTCFADFTWTANSLGSTNITPGTTNLLQTFGLAASSPPTILPLTDRSVTVGMPLNFNVIGTDLIDANVVTLTASNLLPGSTFPPAANVLVVTGTFNWVSAGPVGSYNVTFEATDIHGSYSTSIVINVTPRNPPTIVPIGNISATQLDPLSFDVFANELFENDVITLTASNLPPGATFPPVVNPSSVTGSFNWASVGPPGAYMTTFTASDVDGSTSETITITINPGALPVIQPISTQMVTEGFALNFDAVADEFIDGDLITLSASNLPPGSTFPAVMNTGSATGS